MDAVRQATSSGAQEKATQASYQVADNLAASSAKDDERAKEGLNAAGRFAVDLSKGLIELGIDGLTGKAFGNPVPLRALGTFGSNTQEARQAGATFQQQMAYGAGSAGADAAMRTLLNISESYKKIYGEGPLNKMLQEVVDDLSKTARGRMALSAFVEGGKSLVESEIKHLLRRATYDEDARFDTAGAVYNVILSSAMGAITGAFSPRQKAEQEAQEEVVKPQDSDIIYLPDIQIGHSLGAKAKNYDIMDLKTGEHFNLIEGTYLQNVEVFAGKGVRSLFRNAAIYAERFGGKSKDWQHVKGFGFVDYYGESRLAELHWAQCEGIGKYDFFIKGWME